jgi:hypothetical protein
MASLHVTMLLFCFASGNRDPEDADAVLRRWSCKQSMGAAVIGCWRAMGGREQDADFSLAWLGSSYSWMEKAVRKQRLLNLLQGEWKSMTDWDRGHCHFLVIGTGYIASGRHCTHRG